MSPSSISPADRDGAPPDDSPDAHGTAAATTTLHRALRGAPAVAVFATSARERERVRARLPLDATVVCTGSWAIAAAAASSVDCVLLVRGGDHADVDGGTQGRAPGTHDLAPLVRAVAGRCRTPVVACADVTPRERSELLRAGAAAVVAPGLPARALWGEVQCAVSGALLARTAARLGELRMGEKLRAALALLCTTDPPPSSVGEVCAAVDAPQRTLWYQWQRRVRGSSPRFEDVVTTAVLVRAFMRWERGATWTEAAAAGGVHRHTLTRGARRLLGLTALPPRVWRVADAGHAAARRAFVENVVRPVLRRQAP